MDVFKGKKNRFGVSNIELSENGKHLVLGQDDFGRIGLAFYHDNPENKSIDGIEKFPIAKGSDSFLDSELDRHFALLGGKAYFSFENIFACLDRDKEGTYTFIFEQDMEHINDERISGVMVDDTEDNIILKSFFFGMQNYDPKLAPRENSIEYPLEKRKNS